MRSSISSSETRSRVPWGAAWCLAFFLVAEVAFHFAPRSFFLALDQTDYTDDQARDYAAVNLAIELLPAPEVAIVGTSRAREAVQSPVLEGALGAALDRAVEVRNYGIAGGRIDISLALLERMLHEKRAPRVLVLALDASDFRDPAADAERARLIVLATFAADIERNGWPSEVEMTHILGNSLTLRMTLARPTMRYRLIERGRFRSVDARRGNPALGGTSGWARDFLAARLDRGHDPTMRKNAGRVDSIVRGYVLQERAIQRLRDLVALATSRGIAVVLAEIPASEPIRIRPEVSVAQERLRAILPELGTHPCVSTWSAGPVAETFSRRHFRDPSHLNPRGAEKFVELTTPVIADALRCAARASSGP